MSYKVFELNKNKTYREIIVFLNIILSLRLLKFHLARKWTQLKRILLET